MKCGLYDESYKIAADTNLLVNYLYNCHLKVAYLPEFVTRMRIGGMSTDSVKRKKVWNEEIRVYSGYGFKPVTLTKLMKMACFENLPSIVFSPPSVSLLWDRNLRDERV